VLGFPVVCTIDLSPVCDCVVPNAFDFRRPNSVMTDVCVRARLNVRHTSPAYTPYTTLTSPPTLRADQPHLFSDTDPPDAALCRAVRLSSCWLGSCRLRSILAIVKAGTLREARHWVVVAVLRLVVLDDTRALTGGAARVYQVREGEP
jgi:hypothetical protein